ncbi:hypothetical protein DB88DRAFT_520126 [Papiliotrema laurentii]|uniref:Uncharacterized protein n=1 Tax=Papiliotrema laurentii TaxID=5418 RepID=A0AAD9CWZ5_PAPLA|nr:hypothetical protein DB88DRAFT_548873 [Papiliotrema laurentii]KAK1920711.1 hypothetical protein DB88DRAFT_520126 [Papiliotrema laurentii]
MRALNQVPRGNKPALALSTYRPQCSSTALLQSTATPCGPRAYGQKTPLIERFVNVEPAELDHRWAEHSEWDIGQLFVLPWIWLFALASGRHHGYVHYPMLVPGSGGHGTVNIKATHCSCNFSIKVYPRLILVIKSFNSRLQGWVPKTLQGVSNQVAGCLRMFHSLTSKANKALGGFRIEREAYGLLRATGILVPAFWLGIAGGPHAATPLTAILVSREGLHANANWVYQQAVQADIFQGRSSDRLLELKSKL